MNRRALLIILAFVAVGAAIFWFVRQPEEQPDGEAAIVIPLRTFALNVDPASMADIDSRKVATLIYTGLVAVDADGTIRPRVARSWRRLSPDTLEFTLADGVTFPDGTPVTAERVVSSLCASMQPSHIQSWSLASIAHRRVDDRVECTGLEARGAVTVVIREERPTPWLMEALAGPGGWIVDTRPQPGQYGIRPGTGPYVVSSVVPDNRIELVGRTGGAVPARVARIQFRYIADSGLAAGSFNAGDLDFLEIDTPQLRQLVLDGGNRPLRDEASLHRADVDRVRVVLFNLRRLERLGGQPRAFLDAYSQAVPRAQISARSGGLAVPLLSAFPPDPNGAAPAGQATAAASLPSAELTLLTESDPFSDLIASQLPRRVGNVAINYRTVDRGSLIDAIVNGNFDAALIKVEATHHTPKFWTAFFTPGDPYVAFGTPIAGLPAVDLTAPGGVGQASLLINRQGNWVGVAREIGLYLASSRLSGVRMTGSGQFSFEEIGAGR